MTEYKSAQMATTEFDRNNIIAIFVQGKEWVSKVDGNSYWASVVTLTDASHNTSYFCLEFQYGYGSFYIQESIKQLRERGYIDQPSAEYRSGIYSNGKRVIWSESMQEDCKKREVVAWGKD